MLHREATQPSAVARGTSPLTYQWYETNTTALTGFAVAGQTNASLVVSISNPATITI